MSTRLLALQLMDIPDALGTPSIFGNTARLNCRVIVVPHRSVFRQQHSWNWLEVPTVFRRRLRTNVELH